MPNKDQELKDIELFVDAYERATGERLVFEGPGESPDAIYRRSDASIVGIELTEVRRSPDDAFWQSVLNYQDEMDFAEAVDEASRLVMKKAAKIGGFATRRTILVLAVSEADFEMTVGMAKLIPVEDFSNTGFEEVWIGDYLGIRSGAHREVRLFGLYPEQYRSLTGRSWFDQKPYG